MDACSPGVETPYVSIRIQIRYIQDALLTKSKSKLPRCAIYRYCLLDALFSSIRVFILLISLTTCRVIGGS